MTPAMVMVHGYSGSPADLEPLRRKMVEQLGAEAVVVVTLPGHAEGTCPAFDRTTFVAAIEKAVMALAPENRKIALLGHSTGGVLLLSWLAESGFDPSLLVLAAVPATIDPSYLERWRRHRDGRSEISFTSVARMVSLINAVARQSWNITAPVLVAQGEADDLVPRDTAHAWSAGRFAGLVRTMWIPSGGHPLFQGPGADLSIALVARAVADVAAPAEPRTQRLLAELSAVEPESARFFHNSPTSARHLAASPSGRRLLAEAVELPPVVPWEPVFANIEITTRCNLACAHCARAVLAPARVDMPLERFRRILDLLPHAYRITLVGLGEPLLHPRVVDFVAAAATVGRRVALVTNAMELSPERGAALLAAGLDSIVFSLDSVTDHMAEQVRSGTDLPRVLSNIRTFTQLAGQASRPVSTAVFAAVSQRTVDHLEPLAETVAGLGVAVLMLSDLNFQRNVADSLWQNLNATLAATVRRGIAAAFSRNLPVLSVHGLEEFGLARRYHKSLLAPPDLLYHRSPRRTWCVSPWQTLPIDVHGNVTLCDCQPECRIGNLFEQPLDTFWNGPAMVDHRRRMLNEPPTAACAICPRF